MPRAPSTPLRQSWSGAAIQLYALIPLLRPSLFNSKQDYVMAPVFVCLQLKRTVGLGDAISATGLLANFKPHDE